MNRERDLTVAGTRGPRKSLQHERLAEALVLKPKVQCDAELGCDRVHGREPGPDRQHSHPAGARVRSVNNGDHANVRGASPVFGVDARARGLEYFDGPGRSGRRIPE